MGGVLGKELERESVGNYKNTELIYKIKFAK